MHVPDEDFEDPSAIVLRVAQLRAVTPEGVLGAITGQRDHPCPVCAARILGCHPLDVAVLLTVTDSPEELATLCELALESGGWHGHGVAAIAAYLYQGSSRWAASQGHGPYTQQAVLLLAKGWHEAACRIERAAIDDDDDDDEDDDDADEHAPEGDEDAIEIGRLFKALPERAAMDPVEDMAARLVGAHAALGDARRRFVSPLAPARVWTGAARVLLAVKHEGLDEILSHLCAVESDAMVHALGLLAAAEEQNASFASFLPRLAESVRDLSAGGDAAAAGERLALQIEACEESGHVAGFPFRAEEMLEYLGEALEFLVEAGDGSVNERLADFVEAREGE